jgi:predicted ATP-binding protein involved in virulence
MLLGERLNSSQLKSFSINGLFGFKDIKVPFDKEAVILIAENGSGKTTILNVLYYSISCKFHKLTGCLKSQRGSQTIPVN